MNSEIVTALFGLFGALVGGVLSALANWIGGKRTYKNEVLAERNKRKRDIYEEALSQVIKLKLNPMLLFDRTYRESLVALSGVVRVYSSEGFSSEYLEFGQLVFDSFEKGKKALKFFDSGYFGVVPEHRDGSGAPGHSKEEFAGCSYDEYESLRGKEKEKYCIPVKEIHKYFEALTKQARDDLAALEKE